MYNFSIRNTYVGDNLLIEFYAEPPDSDFHDALKRVLVPMGFQVTTSEQGIWASHPDPDSPFANTIIDSDTWCTFGRDASGASGNHPLMHEWGALLVATGLFLEVPWRG